ncbi:MAG TPA: glycine--tRNA ligase subunit beta [Gammaproteobacteria bacterium]|nr:glycine--tRNA ligase subunit beta [Gammaproteobacteria bacterium]
MSGARDLLIEIGTEELPPKALRRLSEAFEKGVADGLARAELNHSGITAYASPRRLAVLVRSLAVRQPDQTQQRRGPALQAAFGEDGCPTKAAEGFARSCGVAVEDLDKLETDKGAWLVFNSHQVGSPASELVPKIVQEALDRLPIPRRMRWGALEEQFVRPVHWLVLLHGDEVIDAELLGVRSGRQTHGHRFHHPGTLYIGEPAAYAPLLETEGHVLADFEARREAVRAQVLEAAAQLEGGAVIDEDLLDEVTAMVEWPVPVVGRFDARFLEVPAEALISTMKSNQKYFHVLDADGALMPCFIAISNIESREPEKVREGNERVIAPRLADAEFFWNQDRKQSLHSRLESLKQVVFQKKLGTLFDKAERVAALAKSVAEAIGAEPLEAERAGILSKCDLMTDMVGEFPELQGIMGRYYARHDGEPETVAVALDELYMPRFAGDALPASAIGQALAIADRLDTLVGIFGIGQSPTGDKDPFALRRAALGVLRTIIECELPLDLEAALRAAAGGFAKGTLSGQVVAEVFDFMMERLRGYFIERGHAHDTFEAVLAQRPTRPADFAARVAAVGTFRELPEAESLAAANKRISNILRQAGGEVEGTVASERLVEPAERALDERVHALADEVAPLIAAAEYTGALKRLATLREPVDTFFDDVMVMAEDPALRANRLALLNRMRNLFLEVADLSQLQH